MDDRAQPGGVQGGAGGRAVRRGAPGSGGRGGCGGCQGHERWVRGLEVGQIYITIELQIDLDLTSI